MPAARPALRLPSALLLAALAWPALAQPPQGPPPPSTDRTGGGAGVHELLPGIGKMQRQMAEAKIDPKLLKRQQAILSSMTKEERRKPELIKASRKQCIASGSGTSVSEVNKLLKQHLEMQRMMKQMKKLGQKGLMRQGLAALMPRH